MIKKTCRFCEEEKDINEFYKHKQHFDGYDNRCKSCRKSKTKDLNDIKKTAPAKPKHCECCGIESITKKGMRNQGLVCDHDHDTKKFRGWICASCNHGIGKLGDTIEGIERALEYLKKARKNNGI